MIQHSDQREYTMLISQNYSTTKQLKFCTLEPTNPSRTPGTKLPPCTKNPTKDVNQLSPCLGSKKSSQSMNRSHSMYIQHLDIVKKNTVSILLPCISTAHVT